MSFVEMPQRRRTVFEKEAFGRRHGSVRCSRLTQRSVSLLLGAPAAEHAQRTARDFIADPPHNDRALITVSTAVTAERDVDAGNRAVCSARRGVTSACKNLRRRRRRPTARRRTLSDTDQ